MKRIVNHFTEIGEMAELGMETAKKKKEKLKTKKVKLSELEEIENLFLNIVVEL